MFKTDYNPSTMKVQIAPSILSADFGRLAAEVRAVEDAGADVIHVDVMDGRFVPNITIGPLIVKAIKPVTTLPLDCHLMISDPDAYIDAFTDAGADWITVHVEACTHLHRTIQAIKARGVKAGAVLNPATPLATIDYILEDLDMVLLMSVNPGFGGQNFIPSTLRKIRELRGMIKSRGMRLPIEIDGGVNRETIRDRYTAAVAISRAGEAREVSTKIASNNIAYNQQRPSIDENSQPVDISVFPNPSDGLINVDLHVRSAQVISVRVMNLSGQIVYQSDDINIVKAHSLQIDLSQFSSGVYSIFVIGETGITEKKVVIRK
jgi:ribulose-phosphate 3-epimerase